MPKKKVTAATPGPRRRTSQAGPQKRAVLGQPTIETKGLDVSGDDLLFWFDSTVSVPGHACKIGRRGMRLVKPGTITGHKKVTAVAGKGKELVLLIADDKGTPTWVPLKNCLLS